MPVTAGASAASRAQPVGEDRAEDEPAQPSTTGPRRDGE